MGAGLEGVRVLELGGGVAAPLAAKLMADLGATVVKIEPPAGDPARRRGPFPGGRPDPEASGTFLYLNAGKRSVTADLATAAGRATLDALAARADLLVHNLPRRAMAAQGLDFERLAALNPRLVMVSITPFGLSGPYADYAAEELNLAHGGGWGSICPGPGIDPALPPIKPFGQHAFVQAGTHAAVAGLAAHFGAARSGVGEHIDFSVQEIVATIIGRPTSGYVYTGKVESRLKTRSVAPNGFFRCKDGNQVFLFTSEEDQWARLVGLMGNPAWAQDERWVTRETRAEHEVELRRHLEPWVAGWNAADIFRACQERRICCTRAYTYTQLLEDEHLRARGYPTPHRHPVAGELVVPGPPYLLRHKWWRLRGPAPRLGEADGEVAQGAGRLIPATPELGVAETPPARPAPPAGPGEKLPLPLAGVRVLDLTWVWAGPHCCFLLANLGADVIKVESADRPDRFRRAYYPKGMAPGVNRSGAFNHLGQGKRSVSVKLSTPEGRVLVQRLAAACDVVVSNFGTGVMERLGLGAEALLAMKPELIVATISGFGQTGPLRNYMGYGGPITALSGISLATGFRPGQPGEVGTAYGDPNAGGYTAFAIVAALEARRRHGGGQAIDVSLWEAMASTGFEGWMNHALGNPPHQPMGNRDPCWAPHNVYRCAGDDRWVSIAVATEAQWQALCLALGPAIGRPALAGDPRFRDAAARKANEDALDALLAGWCAGQDEWAVTDRLQAAGVPAFPSLNGKDLTESPHLAARGFWERWPHPEVGTLPLASVPWRLARRPSGTRGRAPLLGEHTDAVLTELLALPPAEIERLRGAGVLG